MFGSRLAALRKEKGLSKVAMAKYLGIHDTTYGKYELGKREPDLGTITKLAEYFDVTVDHLLGRACEPEHEAQQPIELIEVVNAFIKTVGIEELDAVKDFVIELLSLDERMRDFVLTTTYALVKIAHGGQFFSNKPGAPLIIQDSPNIDEADMENVLKVFESVLVDVNTELSELKKRVYRKRKPRSKRTRRTNK